MQIGGRQSERQRKREGEHMRVRKGREDIQAYKLCICGNPINEVVHYECSSTIWPPVWTKLKSISGGRKEGENEEKKKERE